MKAFAFASILFLSASQLQAVVLVDKPDQTTFCVQQVEAVCPTPIVFESEDLLFQNVASKLTCLAQNQAKLTDTCYFLATGDALNLISGKTPCKDEFNKKCGSVLDDLKKQIENTSIIGTLRASVDLVDCLVRNAEDLWNKCVHKKVNDDDDEEPVEPVATNCADQALSLCPATTHKVMGLGFTLACLVENAKELGMACTRESMISTMEQAHDVAEEACQLELSRACGKQVYDLQDHLTSIDKPAFASATNLVKCMASNANTLWSVCSTGGGGFGDGSKTHKPTKKPTKHKFDEEDLQEEDLMGKTQRPTKKPTKHKYDEDFDFAGKTHRPTKKPTKHKQEAAVVELTVMDSALQQFAQEDLSAASKTHKPTKKPTKHKYDDEEEDNFAIEAMEEPVEIAPWKPPRQEPVVELSVIPSVLSELSEEVEGKSTKRPTVQPTTAKPTKKPPTAKPTKQMVSDMVELRQEETHSTMSMFAYTVDMDACVESAKRLCFAEVEQINAMPEDASVYAAMDECLDRNFDRIQSECTTTSVMTMDVVEPQQPQSMWMMPPHPPCKHDPMDPSDLPLCGVGRPHHMCHHFVFALVFALVFVVTTLVLMRKVFQCILYRRRGADDDNNNDTAVTYTALDVEDQGERPLLAKKEMEKM